MKAQVRFGRDRVAAGGTPLQGVVEVFNDASEPADLSRLTPYGIPVHGITVPADLLVGNRGPLRVAPGERIELPLMVSFVSLPPGMEREYAIGCTLHIVGAPAPEPPPTTVKHRETGLEVVIPAPSHPPRFQDVQVEAEAAHVTAISALNYRTTYYR